MQVMAGHGTLPLSYFRLVSREMDIYDKNSRCLMTEGEYELLLSEDPLINGDVPKKNGSWENVSF